MRIIIGLIAIIGLFACNNSSTNKENLRTNTGDTATTSGNKAKTPGAVDEIITTYLQVKNGLASDDGKAAADGGDAMMNAISKVNTSPMSDDQKKSFQDIADDMKEMAEHIGKNANKIEHQREHFSMLTDDMDDLLKQFKTGKPLYKDSCPMANDQKGATWYSEIKEIKNPYMGKKMPTCGSIVSEVK
jgi:hypothetical protein